jgi:hypothetical protein
MDRERQIEIGDGNFLPGPPWVIYVCPNCARPIRQGWGSSLFCSLCDYRYQGEPVEVVPVSGSEAGSKAAQGEAI